MEINLPFDIDLPETRVLKAGALKCHYENGLIRDVAYKDSKIITMLYGAVRDTNWNTADYFIEGKVYLLPVILLPFVIRHIICLITWYITKPTI